MSWIPTKYNQGDYAFLAAYLVLPVLLMVTQLFMQQYMTPTPAPTDSNNPAWGMTKQVSLMMTFMFGFFTLQVPAGLTLYWVTSNLLQMLQQWVITDPRFGIAKPVLATVGAGTGKGAMAVVKNGAAVTSANGAKPDTNAVDGNIDAAAKAKETKRRRAKRR